MEHFCWRALASGARTAVERFFFSRRAPVLTDKTRIHL
jgi:hypothetical protein